LGTSKKVNTARGLLHDVIDGNDEDEYTKKARRKLSLLPSD